MNQYTDPDLSLYPLLRMYSELIKSAEQEVQDTSYGGSGGVSPSVRKPPRLGDIVG